MKSLILLIQREFWEHRATFSILPAVIVGAILCVMLLGLIYAPSISTDLGLRFDIQIDGDRNSEKFFFEGRDKGTWADIIVRELQAIESDKRSNYLLIGLSSIATLFSIVVWLVALSFLLNCLFNDRRDRSVLFWKSMPVSDATTVLSKLATALLALPLAYFCGIAILQVSWLILLSLNTSGTELSAWDTVIAPAQIFDHWLGYLVLVLFNGLWALPLWGWLLAVSAYAKSTPLVWALGVPISLIIAEGLVSDGDRLAIWIKLHSMPLGYQTDVVTLLFSTEMVSALLVGTGFIGLAIWLRGHADEL